MTSRKALCLIVHRAHLPHPKRWSPKLSRTRPQVQRIALDGEGKMEKPNQTREDMTNSSLFTLRPTLDMPVTMNQSEEKPTSRVLPDLVGCC